jgi:hypothetical protein
MGYRRRQQREVYATLTISVKVMTHDRKRAASLYPVATTPRPETRGECADGPRPCPFVGCKHHLYLDINPDTGSIKINFPDLEPWELEHSCALDIAESAHTLEEVGELLNITRERIRQLEAQGLMKLHWLARRLRGDSHG